MGYESLLLRYATEGGYTPKVGIEWDKKLCYEEGAYALIRPSVLSEKSGVTRGRITSEVSFVILKSYAVEHTEAVSEMWRKIKCDALQIISKLEASGAILVCREVEIEPLSKQISRYNEVAVEVTATLVSNYIAGDDGSNMI